MQCIRRTANLTKDLKALHFSKTLSTINRTKQERDADWNNAICDAEKIVGYPTSFLNLRWLLNDHVASIALQLRKLIGIDHPLLKRTKKLFHNETPSWSLIVLLISKAAGQNRKFSAAEKDLISGVLHSQHVLSDITEMLRSSHMIHKSLLNLESSMEDLAKKHFGNKIALLSGDYLLITMFNELARLKNHELSSLMFSAVRDLTESDFIGPRDNQNRPFPASPRPSLEKIEVVSEFGSDPLKTENILGNAKPEWTLRNVLGGASLLAKSCQASLLLAEHSEELQRTAYLFGKHSALTMQATKEIETLRLTDDYFNLVSGPVLFHLQHDPDFYAELENLVENVSTNWTKIRDSILAGPGMEKANELLEENYDSAMQALKIFPVSDSRAALERILNECRSR